MNTKQESGTGHMVITDARWLGPDGRWHEGWIEVQGSRIAAAGEGQVDDRLAGAWRLSAGGRMVAPGLIDIHIHGTDGFDCTGDLEQQLGMAGSMPRHGVTSYVAAVVSGSVEDMERAVRSIAEGMRVQASGDPGRKVPWQAEILGSHLEGPFISMEYKGAHDPRVVRDPSIVELSLWLEASGRTMRMVTLAPELPGGLETIRWLKEHGIVANVGHTAATHAQVLEAIEAGATHSVHCFNAMRPLHHREPGATGAILSDSRITAELIADFVHVHPAACHVALASKGHDGLALITDAIAAAGMSPGRYNLGTLEVVVTEDAARLADGTLAGSVLTLDKAVRNVVRQGLLPVEEALHRASAVPAHVVGVHDRKGSIEAGKDADLVCLNEDLQVEWTITRGTIAYERKD